MRNAEAKAATERLTRPRRCCPRRCIWFGVFPFFIFIVLLLSSSSSLLLVLEERRDLSASTDFRFPIPWHTRSRGAAAGILFFATSLVLRLRCSAPAPFLRPNDVGLTTDTRTKRRRRLGLHNTGRRALLQKWFCPSPACVSVTPSFCRMPEQNVRFVCYFRTTLYRCSTSARHYVLSNKIEK